MKMMQYPFAALIIACFVDVAGAQELPPANTAPVVCGRGLLMILDVRLASTRFILTSVILAILFFSEVPPLAAQTSLHTDRSGYTTGTIGSNSVNIYRDRYGNTTGSIGSNRVSTYSDGYGGTTGMIGNKPITTYGDGYGNTTGTIGRDRINLDTDRSGQTTGTIGRRRVFCYTDRFGNTRCN
jgi:hypothetical protein